MWLRISFFHSMNYILLMFSLLENCLTTPFIPPIIDDLALSQHMIDGSLYLGPLVITFLSLLFLQL